MNRILIIGATSAIAAACAREWLGRGPCRFVLVGRNEERLQQLQQDLQARGAEQVDCLTLDLGDTSRHGIVIAEASQRLGQIDIALVAPGTLPDQNRCQQDASVAVQEFSTNATAVISLLTPLANQLEQQRCGSLAVISSVAGDRGRASNYLYGAAKAALSAFTSGLMARLAKSGVAVTLIKPGFVRTPMTAGLPLPEKLVATPEQVARQIVEGVQRRRTCLYTPGFWRYIMLIIRLIPDVIFRRLSL
ncbi:SDR family oxidoreductase [Parathalassolituus penaei]|uniref:SDR family oxidoreductase n=1 Tax=Parathalassolituus penaei TaxID=2997323 RepID=A0A9X3EFM7_9GAMM|nr:SDR family oxidoreductase [Parathalassolituus penaei]MCY0966360.1 SDR family oxidoreductase [Parathalassolituus penaei]